MPNIVVLKLIPEVVHNAHILDGDRDTREYRSAINPFLLSFCINFNLFYAVNDAAGSIMSVFHTSPQRPQPLLSTSIFRLSPTGDLGFAGNPAIDSNYLIKRSHSESSPRLPKASAARKKACCLGSSSISSLSQVSASLPSTSANMRL